MDRPRIAQIAPPRRDRRLPRRAILAAVLAFALLTGPSRAISTVLRTVHHESAFLPAFSAEPTVTVSIGVPPAGATVGRFVSIEATALADAGLAAVRTVVAGTVVGSVAPPSSPTAWRYSTVWDSVATPEGTATIEVGAQDVAGRTATATVQVTLDRTPPRVSISPAPAKWAFSPNGDGRRDVLVVDLSSSEPARMTAVVQAGGRSRVLLAPAGPRSRLRFRWDARISTSAGARPVADGRYPLAVTVADVAGNSVEATYWATVDRVPPVSRWIGSTRPFWPARRQRAVLRLNGLDSAGHALTAAVTVLNGAGHEVRRVKPVSWRGGPTRIVWDGRYASGKVVPPGDYLTRLTVTDAAGNRAPPKDRAVRVHAIRKPVTILSVKTKEKVVALTFDDLYGASRTREILAILKDNGVKATFFPVGAAARANPSLIREILAAGHALGNHSQTHPVMTTLDAAAQRAQLRACEERVRSITGRTTAPLFRPPYGSTDAEVASSAAAEEHPYVFLWDVDTMDWASPGVDRIIGTVTRDVRRGSIVLMHGGPPQTPRALPTMIHNLKAKGYRMVTLPELLWLGGYR